MVDGEKVHAEASFWFFLPRKVIAKWVVVIVVAGNLWITLEWEAGKGVDAS